MTYLAYVWEVMSHSPSTVIVAIGGMLLYACFLRPRWKWWLYPALIALTFLALPALFELFTAVFDESNSYSILVTLLGYWVDVLVLFCFRERFGAIIALLFTQGVLNRLFTFLGYIMYIPMNALLGGDFQVASSIELMFVVMYTVILLVCWLALRKKGRQLIQMQLNRYNWGALAGFAVSAKLIIDFCSDYAFELNPYSDTIIIWAMIALCVFSIAVLSLYLCSVLTTQKSLEMKAVSDLLAFEKEAQKRYYEAQLQNQEELRRMKHDMNGHLTMVSQLLAEENKDEAIRYLASLIDYAESHHKELYSEDPYLNAVVTNYSARFAENDTAFEFEIEPVRMGLHHVEICTALNNALQNALDASLKLPSEQRYVKLQIKTKQNRFLFRITNRFASELIMDGGLPRSTKKDMGHGYGLWSIRDASASLGGFAVCKTEGDMFMLDVAL